MERSVRHLEEMAIFAKVGELGTISAAARALGLPKSSVSRAVAKLENVFSARLVERSTRSVTLTEIGRALHAHCLNLVAEAENAEAEIAAHQGHPSGRLRVSAPYSMGHIVLRPFLPGFLERYPDVDLQLQLTDRTLNPVTDGYDVVIRIGWLEDSNLIARKIADVNAVLVASRKYLDVHGLPKSVEELANHAVVGLPTNESFPLQLTNGSDRFDVRVWPRFACNDPMMNLQMVEQGYALAPVSLFVAAHKVASGELIRVLPDYQIYNPPTVYALYAGRTALSPKIAVFLDFLKEVADRVRGGGGLRV
jgi:molybdate transport repressor ModE-like protein